MYYPEGMKARISPVQSIKPHRILAHSGLEPGISEFRVQSSNHYTTAAHLFNGEFFLNLTPDFQNCLCK